MEDIITGETKKNGKTNKVNVREPITVPKGVIRNIKSKWDKRETVKH